MDTNLEHKTLPPEQIVRGTYEVIVVGAGHAGCEAALASARMGHKTLLLTMNLDSVALMPWVVKSVAIPIALLYRFAC